MPQIFGAEELRLIAESSLWSESAILQGDPKENDLFGQFADQEGFVRDKPLTPEQTSAAGGRLVYSRGLGTKTIKGQPPKTDANGQLLNGDGYHEFVVHLDNSVPEGAKETSVGGKRRYELSYHHVDRNGKLNAQTLWSGNTPHSLNNAHEKFKTAIGRMR